MYYRQLGDPVPTDKPSTAGRGLVTLIALFAGGWLIMGLSHAGAFHPRRKR